MIALDHLVNSPRSSTGKYFLMSQSGELAEEKTTVSHLNQGA